MNEADYNITLFEACEILNKSKKTVSRYIRRGRLTPLKVKSLQGTLEYRFTKTDLDTLRAELARADRKCGEWLSENIKHEGGKPSQGVTVTKELGLNRADRTDQTEGTDETGHAGQTRQDRPPLEKAILSTKQEQTGQSGQGRQDKTGQDRTGQTGQDGSIITILKETTELLKNQLTIKDTQIGTLNEQVHKLIERDRETNILLKGLQDRLMLLEPPKPPAIETTGKTGRGRTDKRLLVLAILLFIAFAVFFYFNILPTLKR